MCSPEIIGASTVCQTHTHIIVLRSDTFIPAASTFAFHSRLLSSRRRVFSRSRADIATSDFHFMAFNRQIVSVFVFEMKSDFSCVVLLLLLLLCLLCPLFRKRSRLLYHFHWLLFGDYNNFNIPLAKWHLNVRIRFMPIQNGILIHFGARFAHFQSNVILCSSSSDNICYYLFVRFAFFSPVKICCSNRSSFQSWASQ